MIRFDMFIFSQISMHNFSMVSVPNSCITYITAFISYTAQNEDRQRKMKEKGRNRKEGRKRKRKNRNPNPHVQVNKWWIYCFFSLYAKVLLPEYFIAKQSSMLQNISFLSSLWSLKKDIDVNKSRGYSILFKTIHSRKCYYFSLSFIYREWKFNLISIFEGGISSWGEFFNSIKWSEKKKILLMYDFSAQISHMQNE